jgi:phage-related protein
METLKQCATPLNTLYFSDYNINLVQRAIRQQYKTKYGIAIDYQNSGDLFTIMRVVFINNSEDPYKNTCDQVRSMNEKVIKTALGQINTGVSQYMGYLRDAQAPLLPLAQPINTSTYGKKVGLFQPVV